MHRRILPLFLLALIVGSCSGSNENDDITQEVNHDGSVESAIHISDLDSTHRLLTTTHKIWVKGGLYRTVAYYDTLPALGKMPTVVEDKNGDSKEVIAEKDYEIFITVK
ncbi:MAG: hypothetical protein EOO15_13975 [Chitinophagaceae bacterium]|nr:MAG: hypothetical protein EOO15_13975 [Chitinophagaceae bacterium]